MPDFHQPSFDGEQLEARYAFAKRVALAAAQRAMAFYTRRSSLIVEHKGGDLQDVVSIADQDVEAFIRGELAMHFPDDGLSLIHI